MSLMVRVTFVVFGLMFALERVLAQDPTCEAGLGGGEGCADDFSALQLRSRSSLQKISRAVGRTVTQIEWQTEFDFIVKLPGCTGIVWKDMVLTAATCNIKYGGFAQTANNGIIKLTNWTQDPRFPWRYDYALLTLASPVNNSVPFKLESNNKDYPNGLSAGGFGVPDTSSLTIIDNIPTKIGGERGNPAIEMDSGSESDESICSGDDGGPTWEVQSETCAQELWPKSRECASFLGQGNVSNAYRFVDGTGVWCSDANGVHKFDLTAAMGDCTRGSFQGMKAPCIGVVFNAPQPGEEGSASGKYTTCWSTAPDGLGWQVALKPVSWRAAYTPLPEPRIVIVNGVNSYSYPACADSNTIGFANRTSDAKSWIEEVAPGHFEWTA